jgi:ribosomal protein L11 methyltransferase
VSNEESPLYREGWVSDHQPLRFGASLIVGPRGTRRSAQPGDRVVELELFPNTPASGVVFGTGEHETTRMVLAWLERFVREGDRVLDVGTGSGILALAAARLGAREVMAVDIDPVAIRSAEGNVSLNDLGGSVRVRQGSVEVVGDAEYDLVLANILSPVIREVAPMLWRLLRAEGSLIVSGIVAVEADDVREMLVAHGFRAREECREGGWQAFVLQKE